VSGGGTKLSNSTKKQNELGTANYIRARGKRSSHHLILNKDLNRGRKTEETSPWKTSKQKAKDAQAPRGTFCTFDKEKKNEKRQGTPGITRGLLNINIRPFIKKKEGKNKWGKNKQEKAQRKDNLAERLKMWFKLLLSWTFSKSLVSGPLALLSSGSSRGTK